MPVKFIPLALLCAAGCLPVRAGFEDLVRKGDLHDRQCECDKALTFYLPAEQLQPRDASLLVKISRQYALRMTDCANDAEKLASGRKAVAYAERALALQPEACDPNLCLAVCLGKLSPYVGNREKVEVSRRIKMHAGKAVLLEPRNDLAWHILGRWHQALANLDGATRAVAAIVYGGLPPASNDEALRCFQKALALSPKRMLHVVELGRTLALMGRKDEARKYLEKGIAMPNREKDDRDTKDRARLALRDIS